MKKILSILCITLVMTGCSLIPNLDNTPTKQVEKYLSNYQTLNSNVLTELDSIVDQEMTFDEDQKTTYREILKKHYQDLTYTVKEETVNGDKATVEVEIEVNDYTKVLKESESYRTTNESDLLDEQGIFDETKFNDYKLDLLEKNTERVKYTIYFSLTKSNNQWILNELNNTEQEKILGIYEY